MNELSVTGKTLLVAMNILDELIKEGRIIPQKGRLKLTPKAFAEHDQIVSAGFTPTEMDLLQAFSLLYSGNGGE